MNKVLLASVAVLVMTGIASAQATLDTKGTTSQGSPEGVGASTYTGNGDYVGGNGTSGVDQTTYAGSRVQALKDAGMFNGNGYAGAGNGGNGAASPK